MNRDTLTMHGKIWRGLTAFVGGLLFGAGLAVAQMVDPHKIQGFLDFAGHWDPSLALVMVGALAVTAPGYYLLRTRRSAPLCDARFHLPEQHTIDRPLLLGAALFGIGWGLAGYCPGPAFAALVINPYEAVMLLLGIGIGFIAHRLGQRPH